MHLLSSVVLAAVLTATPALAQPALEASTRSIDLGTVIGSASVEQTVTITNRGPTPVRIRDVRLKPPLLVTSMKSLVEPGQSVNIVLGLGPSRPPGRFEGTFSVNYDGATEPLVVEVRGVLAPGIEIRPKAELVAVTNRGEEARDTVEIVNNLENPIEIGGAVATTDRWTTSIEAIEPGRRWRLSLVLSGRGPAGKQTDTLTLTTSDPHLPTLPLRVRTSLRERVYSFPDRLDFGLLRPAAITPDKVGLYDTSVMVYQKDGRDFQVKVSTDVPFLVLRPEKSTKFPDRWQIFCSIDPSKLAAGQSGGSLVIETSDAQFPRLVVPVVFRVE